MSIQQLVASLKLQPHPEGGFYREVYRAAEQIPASALPSQFGGSRSFSTSIYFLLTANNFSAFHRIASDEIWHFYSGDPLHVHVLDPQGHYQLIQLGNGENAIANFQAVVPAGSWFASESKGTLGYSLVGCTVAPGFDFTDFELANAKILVQQYPAYADLIQRLCR